MLKHLLWTTTAILLGQATLWAGLPDLIINSNSVNPTITTRSFASNDCEVLYGCANSGIRTLLEFNTEVENIGNADLFLGNPTNNPLFYYSSCYGRYYFKECALYNLIETNGNTVVASHKGSFCIEDVTQWNPSANTNRVYTCSYQGIQQGWADVYPAGLPCQWIDITGVAPGNYLLQLVVNPYGTVEESDTNNNTVEVPVTIPCSAPANDSFTNAQVLAGVTPPQAIFANNFCATTEPNEPWIENVRGGSSIWFSWTPSTSQTVYLTTLGSDFPTLLAVYTGTSIATMSQVAANTNIGHGILQSALTFSAVAGTTYMITVDGVSGAQGMIQLSFGPANDMFTNALEISGVSGSTYGYSVGATRETGEPPPDGTQGGHSIWYRWTAPTNGMEIIDTIGSDFDTVLAIYTGNTVNALTPVAADDDSGGNRTSRAHFNAVAGTTYRILVDGYTTTNVGTASGDVQLNWNPPCHLTVMPGANPVQMNIAGGFGSYAIQYSSNCTQWATFTNFYLGQSNFTFTDSRGLPMGYYRGVLMPSQ